MRDGYTLSIAKDDILLTLSKRVTTIYSKNKNYFLTLPICTVEYRIVESNKQQ